MGKASDVPTSVASTVRDARDLQTARRAVSALCDEHGVDQQLTGDVVLAATELATNGLRHGQAAVVNIETIVDRDRVELVIRHLDQPAAPLDEPSGDAESAADELRPGGRGLSIVDAVSSAMRVVEADGGRTNFVSFERR